MYKATQNLKTTNLETNVKIQFIVYNIDKSMPIPFLKVYLVKDCEQSTNADPDSIESFVEGNEYLTFPSIDYNAQQHFLFNLYCQGVVESLFHEEREYVQEIQHKGYLLDESENTAYAFFELTPTTTEAEYMTRETFIWPAMMDEILHKNSVFNLPIHSMVTSFFMSNPSFIYLSDVVVDNPEESAEPVKSIESAEPKKETPKEVLVYEMPVVVYHPVIGKYTQAQFTSVFGVTREDGVYTFYSYERALSILNETPKNKKWLVRVCLYTGNTTIDKEEFDSSSEFQTFYHGYEYQTKEYTQQKPLSYHSVVNRTNYNLTL